MGNGHHQLDMAHTLSTYLAFGNFHTATVANSAFVSDSLIFTAVTFPVLDGSEDFLAEQTVTFGLVGTVIDSLGFQYFTMRLV